MTRVSDIYNYIDRFAPYSLQEDYDNSGKNVIFSDREVKKVLIALDITNEIVDEAETVGAELIVTHHPVIFRSLKALDGDSIAVKLCMKGISALSAHTNFDSAVMNDILCEELGMNPAEPLAVENNIPVGKVCELDKELTSGELAALVKGKLGNTVVRYNDTGKMISRVAVCGGSGGSFLKNALRKNADAYITGDVKHDVFIDAHNAGLCVLDAGHFHTENIFCEFMKRKLSEGFADTQFLVSAENRDILSYEI